MKPQAMSRPESADEQPVAPWWREPMVWLVISGPLVVVVAGVVTAVIAVRGADPVIKAEPDSRFESQPAVQGRNHAATQGQKK